MIHIACPSRNKDDWMVDYSPLLAARVEHLFIIGNLPIPEAKELQSFPMPYLALSCQAPQIQRLLQEICSVLEEKDSRITR